MWSAFGGSLPEAVGVALSPIPIVAVVLMLVTPRAKTNGPMFIVGWIVGLGIIGTVVLSIGGPASASDNGAPATWSSWLKIILGILLLRVASRQWRARPHGEEEPPVPKWMGAIDSFGPGKAVGAGVVLAAVNPKNLILAVAGAAAIAQTGISGADQAIAYALFTIVATVGVAIPVAVYFFMGPRAPEILERLRAWMAHNNNVIMAVICLVIAAKLVGDAISGLTT